LGVIEDYFDISKNMKKNYTAILIIFSFFITIFQTIHSQPNENTNGDLIIIISGLRNDKGDIKIGLFNSENSWNGKKDKFRGATLKIKNKKVEWVIKDIPYGEYAIKFFHDENGDDKINTNFLGIPTETYGFYMSGISKYIPPTFNKAKFMFKSREMTIEIKTK
jgi:uncharacterized protein (DUF2141 family)